jgi:hypothetical protein
MKSIGVGITNSHGGLLSPSPAALPLATTRTRSPSSFGRNPNPPKRSLGGAISYDFSPARPHTATLSRLAQAEDQNDLQ